MKGFVEKTKVTPPEVAAMWGISVAKVLRWISSGELRAIDASSKRKQRPRYLIDIEDLSEFEERRSTTPRPKSVPRRRRQVDDYY
jgi:transposase